MIKHKNILFIAPVPSESSGKPITGNALPIIKTIDLLMTNNNVEIVDLSKEIKSGFTLSRMIDMISIFFRVYKAKNNKDIIYLTIAESSLGNWRDIIIYCLCYGKLKNTIIHMLGGANIKNILNKDNGMIFKINRYFISRIGAVIVEGEAQKKTFSHVTSEGKIYINPNFAEDYLFIKTEDLELKFSKLSHLRVLFLSNFLEGKGFEELVAAYLLLDTYYKSIISIDFVGNFPDEDSKNKFEKKISNEINLKYHGPLKEEAKRKIYQQAHIFCMPTYYAYEGQPFCIVESYAAGCMVITTNHSGIGQVFKNEINGYEVVKESIDSVKDALMKAVDDKDLLIKFAMNNLREAKEKYTLKKYLEKQLTILNSNL